MPQNEETFTSAKNYLQIKFINRYFHPHESSFTGNKGQKV